MKTQPYAVGLADGLARALQRVDADDDVIDVARWFVEDTEVELRRLHAVNEELRGALDEAMWHVKYKELKAVNESDTALLRKAWEALRNDDIQQRMKAITALRERLGEKM